MSKTKKNIAHKILLPVLVGFLVMMTVINIATTFFSKPQQFDQQVEYDYLSEEIEFWEDLVRSHPTYRDGYEVLSRLYEQSGQVLAAQDSKNRAQSIDPNN